MGNSDFSGTGILAISLLLAACNSGGSGSPASQVKTDVNKQVKEFVSSCPNDGLYDGEKPFTLKVTSADTVEVGGTICSGSLDAFNKMYLAHPSVKNIKITQIDGSANDEVNLQMSTKVHANGLVTHLSSQSSVASGGTDFFLAGNLRTIADGAKIGVHNWRDGTGKKGIDYPKDSPEHKKYLDYYAKVGISADFYWFTLMAKPNGTDDDGDMHWMTKEEINKYGLAI